MSPGRDRYRLALTPGGAGVLTLFFPGLLVAIASGQRPLTALSIGAALVLAANAVWARMVLGRLTVGIEGPAAATVGEAASLVVSLGGPRGMEGAVAVDGGLRPWVPTRVPGSGLVLWRAGRRGVVERVTVRVQTSIPLGLTAVVRISSVPVLSSGDRLSPIHVVPAPAPAVVPPVPAGPGPAGPAVGPGDPVGLRQYRIGDIGRDVHWPTVARTGTLMVRDRPDPAGDAATVVVISAWGPSAAGRPTGADGRLVDERVVNEVVARGRTVLLGLLSTGHRVELRTLEAGTPTGAGELHIGWFRRTGRRHTGRSPGVVQVVGGPVRSRDDIARRLARIAPGPLAHDGSPIGSAGPLPAEVPVLVVDGSGQRWQ